MIHGEPWRDTTTETYDDKERVTSSATEHWMGDAPHLPK
jgi:hypothetical protein